MELSFGVSVLATNILCKNLANYSLGLVKDKELIILDMTFNFAGFVLF